MARPVLELPQLVSFITFHGRAQLESFFERAGLVNEVTRLLSTAENEEDVLEFCIERLENLSEQEPINGLLVRRINVLKIAS